MKAKLFALFALLVCSLSAQEVKTRLFPPGTPLKLTVTAEGTQPFTYVWSREGSTPANNSAWRQPTLSIPSLTEKETGLYAVEVKNSAGVAIASLRVRIGVEPPSAPVIRTEPAGKEG